MLYYSSAKFFVQKNKKLFCLTIIQKQKVFILELSLNNSKLFRRLVKQHLDRKGMETR